ncbi:glycoside hydrolase family 18 protein [Fulvivirgaceae bacterium BMA10]|uniref:chitinase n=1 Tax=Splendidivirga corallicola TaxID=3051826 RepID=A0ABT8KZ19_9BACT|nr:glycoside hydrolase family 18 protein [Fulvivirgaceae bacterium BMA10]
MIIRLSNMLGLFSSKYYTALPRKFLRAFIFEFVFLYERFPNKKMTRILVTSVLLIAVFSCNQKEKDQVSESNKNADPDGYKIIAYVHGGDSDWGSNDELASKVTHINYAFANVIDGKVVLGNEADPANLERLNQLKLVNPALQILISVGGWSWSGNFSDAVLTETSRNIFANSAIDFMLKYNLDGVDLDWEYPGQIGNGNVFRPEDKENFTAILKLIREKLDSVSNEKHYLLTIATGANQNYLDNTDLATAQKYLDFINIMTYDFHGAWAPNTGHHANLFYSEHDQNGYKRSVSAAVDEHMAAGIPKEKLVLGLPFYGRYWTGVENEGTNGLYQTSTGEGGGYSYNKLERELIDQQGYKRFWDESAKVPYLWNAEKKEFVTYDDPKSFKIKIDYLQEKGLSGVMFWQYTGDSDKHTLLNVLYDNLKE